MKTSHFFYILIAIILASCGQGQNNNEYDDYGYDSEYFEEDNNRNLAQSGGYQQNNQGNQNSNNNSPISGGKKVFKIKDPQGQVVVTFPIPSNWRQGKGDIFLESKDGVKVTNDLVNEFSYSHIPDYNQMLRENRIQVKPVKSLERFIREDFAALTQSKGIKLTNIQKTPSITQAYAQKDRMWYKGSPEQMTYDSAIVDFTDAQGNPSFVLITYYVGSDQYKKRWGYTITGVEAPRAIFEQTKRDYLFAVTNARLNPQYVQAKNQQMKQQSQQGYAAHKERMRGIKAFGENNTKMFNARGAANDAQYNSWREGQVSSDRIQRGTVNSINDVNTWTDRSGNNIEVEGYHNKVYTNGHGEAIGTDDWNYNPNGDTNVNGSWEQLDATDDGWN